MNGVEEMENVQKGRKLYLSVACVFIWGFFLVSQLFGGTASDLTYADPRYGFRLVCPGSGWIITDETGMPEVRLIVKSKTEADGFIPNVTVAIEFLSHMMTAVEYGERNKESLNLQGYKIQSWGKTIIGKNACFDLVCSSGVSSIPIAFRHLCLVKDRIAYVITCSAPKMHYEKYTRDFERIVNSFRFR